MDICKFGDSWPLASVLCQNEMVISPPGSCARDWQVMMVCSRCAFERT